MIMWKIYECTVIILEEAEVFFILGIMHSHLTIWDLTVR